MTTEKETEKARKNFCLENKRTNLSLIYSVVTVKKAVAVTYEQIGVKPELYRAVQDICDEILCGEYDEYFVLDALQGGAGTSTNMNVNEVIAQAVFDTCKMECHPIDDVNRGQSTNDVYPTALRISAINTLRILSDECAKLQQALQEKENEFASINKIGRTELMDAVPITLGGEFGCYAQAIARDRWRLYKVEERLRQVNIGGTAVGKYHNSQRQYRFKVIENLRELTGIGLCTAEYPMDVTQNNDVFVEVSGLLKALSVNLMKIANDLRIMNSNAVGEIHLRDMQRGSSIMPGKVNPVIPEMVIQCAIKVQANDYAVTACASHGELELNAFIPLIADSLLESLELLAKSVRIFREKCIEFIEPNRKRCEELLENSYAFCTEYAQTLGYETVERVVKNSKNGKTALEALNKMTENKK